MLTTKKCIDCKKVKKTSEFKKHRQKPDGLYNYCKTCTSSRDLKRRRTKKGFISNLYSHQVQKSKKRKHQTPSYTLSELEKWCVSQEKFHIIFKEWEISNYSTKLAPSVDRLDDYLPYTIDNIRLVTWEENNTKGKDDRKRGVNNKCSKTVYQFSLSGELIKTHYSGASAARELGVNQPSISRACLGGRPTAYGYRWSYNKEGASC